MFLVTVAQLMGYAVASPYQCSKSIARRAAARFVDRAVDTGFSWSHFLRASKLASNGTLVLAISCLLINKLEAHAVR
jgi:hypothetical protein